MAKLTIEIEENEFALYDADVYLNGRQIMVASNYTSEEAAFKDIYDYVREYSND